MNEQIVKLENVRLSFPALWEAKKGPDANSKSAFQATFILDKKTNAASIKAVKAAIDLVTKDSFKGKQPPKICLREGSEKPDTDGYGDGVMFVGARSETRPMVVDRDGRTPLTAADGKPYAGCIVNATIRVWPQDNQYGKRINSALRAVQFVKDGDAFGDKPINMETEFAPLDNNDVI
jgi:hypothetical protein